MRRLLQAVVMSLVTSTALAGSIDFQSPPIQSGEVTTFDDHHVRFQQELSPDQLRALAHWLSWNHQGWFATQANAPPQPVQLQFNLRHSDGTRATLSVVAVTGRWKHDAFFINEGAPWSYHAWLGLVKKGAATRPLSDYDLDLLQKIARK
jgi:hypothetical protein